MGVPKKAIEQTVLAAAEFIVTEEEVTQLRAKLKERVEEAGVRLFGDHEPGFPRWLIERGILPNVWVPVQKEPLELVPAGEIRECKEAGNKLKIYTCDTLSLKKVWERYGPPVSVRKGKKDLNARLTGDAEYD